MAAGYVVLSIILQRTQEGIIADGAGAFTVQVGDLENAYGGSHGLVSCYLSTLVLICRVFTCCSFKLLCSEPCQHLAEAVETRFEVFDDFFGEVVGFR